MITLSDAQRTILTQYKNDLRRGNLQKLAKDLMNNYKYDRGEIVAYMLEKNVPILEEMPYLPFNGICECSLPVLSIPGNVRDIKSGGISNNLCKEIILEEGVEKIGKQAITNNKNLEKIILPNSLRSLGEQCFADNYNLKEVFIPDNITILPKGIFDNCDNVTILVNYREDKRDRLKCVESERDFYKNHLKWIRGE